jgi:chromate transporter
LFILLAGLIGMLILPIDHKDINLPASAAPLRPFRSLIWLWGFAGIGAALLFMGHAHPDRFWFALSQFYLAGSLVFGGGHVVLPLLQASVVETELVSLADFLAGYGMAQVIPGPLFTFGGFLGAVMGSNNGMGAIWFGIITMLMLFLPSFLLVLGVMPFWEGWMRSRRFQAAMAGINAAVVGLLAAVLIDPVLVSAIHDYVDVAVVGAGCIVLLSGRVNTGIVVLGLVAVGWLI